MTSEIIQLNSLKRPHGILTTNDGPRNLLSNWFNKLTRSFSNLHNHNYRASHLTSFNTHSPHKCGRYITMPPWWNPQPWCLPPRAPKIAPQWMPRARPPIGVAAVCGRRRSWTCRPRRSKSSLEARGGQDDPSINISNIGVMWLTMLNPVHGDFTWSIISQQRKNQSSDLVWGGKFAGNHLPTEHRLCHELGVVRLCCLSLNLIDPRGWCQFGERYHLGVKTCGFH